MNASVPLQPQVIPMQLLTLPPSPALATSIRATAQVFEDPKSQALLAHVQQVAPSDATVLIIGETGTGKELIARHPCMLSSRRQQPFVAINCGAFSAKRWSRPSCSATSGARSPAPSGASPGWFEKPTAAPCSSMKSATCRWRCRSSCCGCCRSAKWCGSVRARRIADRRASARGDQRATLQQARWRPDASAKTCIIGSAWSPWTLPPLRERPGDIMPLTRHFIEDLLREDAAGLRRDRRSAATPEHKLAAPTSWPGNIRELENVIHHTLLICRNGVIQSSDLRLSNLRLERQEESTAVVDDSTEALLARAFQKLFEEQAGALHEKVEDALLRAAYRFSHYNQVHTAQLLGLSRNVIRARLIKIGELAVNKRRPGEQLQGDRMMQLSV
jgi:DNA-binding protein Fis